MLTPYGSSWKYLGPADPTPGGGVSPQGSTNPMWSTDPTYNGEASTDRSSVKPNGLFFSSFLTILPSNRKSRGMLPSISHLSHTKPPKSDGIGLTPEVRWGKRPRQGESTGV